MELAGNSSYPPRKGNRGSTVVLIFDTLRRLLVVQPTAKQMLNRTELCLQHFNKEVIMKTLKIAPDSSLSHTQYQVTGPRIESSAYSNSHGNDSSKATLSLFCLYHLCIRYYIVLLELNNQRERLQALEEAIQTSPSSSRLLVVCIFQSKNFMQL